MKFCLKFLKKCSCHWKGSHLDFFYLECKLHSYSIKSGEGIKKSNKRHWWWEWLFSALQKRLVDQVKAFFSWIKCADGAICTTEYKGYEFFVWSRYTLERGRADYRSGFRLWNEASNIKQFSEFSYRKAIKSLNELISNQNMSLEFWIRVYVLSTTYFSSKGLECLITTNYPYVCRICVSASYAAGEWISIEFSPVEIMSLNSSIIFILR